MISLTLPCDVDDALSPPFVTRLTNTSPVHEQDAMLVGADTHIRMYQYGDRSFSLPENSADDYAGDVVFVEPSAGRAQRWIRASSSHNTLLITEQCDQLCQMCSQPPKKSHTDYFEYFDAACRLAPEGSTIGVSGGEPTLHKEKLFDFLLAMAGARPDLRFHVLTNAQHFERWDIAHLRQLRQVLWGVPLYAATAELHDEIVGKVGAYERLLESFPHMGHAGAAIELRTVLMRSNAAGLSDVAEFIVDKIPFIDFWAVMQLECTGFAKGQWGRLFFDHSRDFSLVGPALSTALLHGTDISLYNFPLCTVPVEWRPYAAQSISDWKNKYIKTCNRCSVRSKCAGFFEWHPGENSYEGLAAL